MVSLVVQLGGLVVRCCRVGTQDLPAAEYFLAGFTRPSSSVAFDWHVGLELADDLDGVVQSRAVQPNS
jgi:hypothetical protein